MPAEHSPQSGNTPQIEYGPNQCAKFCLPLEAIFGRSKNGTPITDGTTAICRYSGDLDCDVTVRAVESTTNPGLVGSAEVLDGRVCGKEFVQLVRDAVLTDPARQLDEHCPEDLANRAMDAMPELPGETQPPQ